MYVVQRGRMLALAALVGVTALALPAQSNAASDATVSGAGEGSTVIVSGDSAANKFTITWIKVNKKLRVQDQNGGTINTSPFCIRALYFGVPVASAVDCIPFNNSGRIRNAALHYGGGNDTAPPLTAAGMPNVTVDGGDGNDSLNATRAKGGIIYGGTGNDKLYGGPYGDQIYGGAVGVLIDPSFTDEVWSGGGTDFVMVHDGVGGDKVHCPNFIGPFADAGLDIVDAACGYPL